MKKFFQLVLSIALCEGAGILGSVVTIPAIPTWYQTLIKPTFSPPNWIFEPAWIFLYLCMGIALFLVLQHPHKKHRKKALLLFFLQLAVNVLWSYAFFGLHAIRLAFVDILVLWCLIVLTMQALSSVSRKAVLLFVPYIVWVSFALVLNASLIILNQ